MMLKSFETLKFTYTSAGCGGVCSLEINEKLFERGDLSGGVTADDILHEFTSVRSGNSLED